MNKWAETSAHQCDSALNPNNAICPKESAAQTRMSDTIRTVSLEPVISFDLPCFGMEAPGLLNTIVRDGDGNIYYSDETNHTVSSLDKQGALRWMHGGNRTTRRPFHRPMGIAIGKHANSTKSKAICVCDSWSDRVKVLDLDGNHIESWVSAGDIFFKRPCDIRFLDSDVSEDGYWLLLDRDNNRLCALNLEGKLIFQIGRALSPGIEEQWRKDRMEPFDNLPAGDAHAYPLFDPIFYPSRILGKTEYAIHLYEPISGRLKQPFLGNIIPLSIQRPANSEWISSDESLFVAWSRLEQTVCWFDFTGQSLCKAEVPGNPVASNLPANELWIQHGKKLQLYKLDSSAFNGQFASQANPFEALHHSALKDLGGVSKKSHHSPFSILESISDEYIGACNELLDRVENDSSDLPALRELQERLISIRLRIGENKNQIAKEAHRIWMAGLPLRLLKQCGRVEPASICNESILDRWSEVTGAATARIVEAAHCLRKAFLLSRRCRRKRPDLSQGLPPLLSRQSDEIENFIRDLHPWMGNGFPSNTLVSIPTISTHGNSEPCKNASVGRWIRPPNKQILNPSSRLLREIDRIRVTAPGSDCSPNPTCIEQAPDGSYFVGLSSTGSILHLNKNGNLLGSMFGDAYPTGALHGLAGICFDDAGRLWILEHIASQIRIVDIKAGTHTTISCYFQSMPFPIAPLGICRGWNGAMLVADSNNDCILSVTESGSITVLAGQSGMRLGELLYPICVFRCPVGTSGSFWVVDQQNHRLQQFDREGNWLSQISSYGTRAGSFFLPHRAAQFSDGTLVVSYRHFDQCLRAFSAEGDEVDRLFLDYKPAGVFVKGDLLFVTEWKGHQIRIYQRL
jgi:hypothetical protein